MTLATATVARKGNQQDEPIGTHKATLSAVTFIQCQNMQYNVLIVGWLGVIISCSVLMATLLTIKLQPEIEELLKVLLLKSMPEQQEQLLMNLLPVFSSMMYALSLINAIVCLLLVIGVTRKNNVLLCPWLLFHGVLFGFGLYISLFYLTVGLFIDLSSFMFCLLVFALIMVIYFKMYQEVFSLFKIMELQKQEILINYIV